MMLLAVLSWWYTAGWAGVAERSGRRISTVMEAFSVELLMGSLFAPFKQISVGGPRGKSFDAQLRALGDQLFSRAFGAVIRSTFIILGVLSALFTALLGLMQLVLWPVVPFLPIVGIALMAAGLTL